MRGFYERFLEKEILLRRLLNLVSALGQADYDIQPDCPNAKYDNIFLNQTSMTLFLENLCSINTNHT